MKTETGLSVTYNLYLPQGYDASESHPTVAFIADSSCARSDAASFVSCKAGSIEAGSGGGMGGSSYHMASFN